jgi:hypothetical protein
MREESERKWAEEKAENERRWEEKNRKWAEEKAENERRRAEEKAENERKWEEQKCKLAEEKAENERKWEEQNRKWAENQVHFEQVHEEIMAMTARVDRRLSAMGARWGISSERTFREALAAILEQSFGVRVINVNEYDDEGTVFGQPDQVELDVIIKNGLLILCELKSSMSKSDMYIFKRKAEWYERRHQRKANRLLVISPMIDPRAKAVGERLGLELYSDSAEVAA